MLSARAICAVFLILFGAMEFVLRQGATARSLTGAGGVIRTVVVCLLLALAYTYRIATEERMLEAALGADYEAYRQRSWRLIPFVF